jgi:hypothetical protein
MKEPDLGDAPSESQSEKSWGTQEYSLHYRETNSVKYIHEAQLDQFLKFELCLSIVL